jgi:hypothetical protein
MTPELERPIFFIGVPRSGTTIAFEAFARHPRLAWPTNYTARFPALPQMGVVRRLLDNRMVRMFGRKGQHGRQVLGNRFLPMPNEAYEFWNRFADRHFAESYLDAPAGQRARAQATRAVRALAAWQGRSRFAAKLTGPPRIEFLSAIFPDAIFVHVVRDGRAVVHSLLNVRFWRDNGGMSAPFWKGGRAIDPSENPGHDPALLAAIQWRDIVLATRREASGLPAGQFLELRYEDFVKDPHASISGVLHCCSLPHDTAVADYIEASPPMPAMNAKYLRAFSAVELAVLSRAMQPCLSMYGYD